jgi:phenylalanyl-tRNA synthetase beta chain
VLVCGRPAGHLGELHPTVLATFDLEGRAVALELELEPVLEVRLPRRARPLPRFPAVNRDLGVVVDESVTAAELKATIEAAGGDLLESATAFDEYRGSQVPEGRKSVAFAMTFRSSQRTLTDAEVDQSVEAIKAALRERHGAAFRD